MTNATTKTSHNYIAPICGATERRYGWNSERKGKDEQGPVNFIRAAA